jgi:hypothetical protein
MEHESRLVMVLLALALALGGCATSRSELQLTAPATSPSAKPNPNAPPAFIRSVKDERVFEEAPTDPSIPSLGFEGAQQAAAATRLRAIGRKRNTFGKALGDVLLQEGQTVESVVRENLAASLREAGYDVRNEPPGESALIVDVRIRKFWSWIQPGFWAITVHSEIVTDITLSTRPDVATVSIRAEDPRQLVTESAWLEAMQKTLLAYRREAVQKLSNSDIAEPGAARKDPGSANDGALPPRAQSIPKPAPSGAQPSGGSSTLNLDDLSGLLDKQQK